MLERGLHVDHTTIYRWVQYDAPELEKRCLPHLNATNDSWRVDETYVKVKKVWMYLYRAVDSQGNTDLIILPGTKNTLSDMAWLWRQGLAQHIRQCVKRGCAVMGICGGYQMLGERLSDFAGAEAESGTVEPGLNLLPVETLFEPINEKITRPSEAQVDASALRGLFAHMSGQRFQAYQIHVGRTVTKGRNGQGGTCAFEMYPTGKDGWLSADGWRAGCYLHGLFENDTFRQSLVAALAGRHSVQFILPVQVGFNRQLEYDKLADLLRRYMDIPRLKALCNLMS